MRFKKSITIAIIVISTLFFYKVYSASIFQLFQGGTGSNSTNLGFEYNNGTAITPTSTPSFNSFYANNGTIINLSNLTSNGFVKTSGGNGALSIDTNTYQATVSAYTPLSISANQITIATSSASVSGFLTSSNWTTFNSKADYSFGANNFSGTGSFIGGNATTTGLTVQGGTKLGSLDIAALNTANVITNSNLANSTISGIALGSNLANLTATDGTLTFSGTYNGSTARTIGLNLSNINSWTGGQTFLNATSTASLSIPNSSIPSLTGQGDISIATAATSTGLTWNDGTAQRFSSDVLDKGFPIASTTWTASGGANGTTTIPVSTATRAQTWISIWCYSDTGTGYMRWGDGTNWMNYSQITTTNTNTTLNSNNTLPYGSKIEVQIWGFASTPNYLTCTPVIRKNINQ